MRTFSVKWFPMNGRNLSVNGIVKLYSVNGWNLSVKIFLKKVGAVGFFTTKPGIVVVKQSTPGAVGAGVH